MKLAMLNDRIVPVAELDPIYFDRGIYFGDGVYEVLRSYNGKIFALQEHLQRFANSLAAIRITSMDIPLVRDRVERAFLTVGLPNVKIYFHVTRGSAPRSHVWDTDLEPNFLLTVSELIDNPEEKARGIAVSTHPDWRWKRCDIKSLNLLANVLARQDATDKGSDEAILVDEHGRITEGAGSTFFEFVIRAGGNIGLEVKQECLTPQQAVSVDELFIAVTTRDIVPVVRFDNVPIKDGTPGPYTKALTREFLKFTL